MHQDAHYYGVLAFARACGFSKEAAWTLAYASQYVDDAQINQLSIDGKTYGISLDDDSPPSLLNMATCHAYSKIKTFNESAMINNTCAFHFVPGCEGESFTWRMVCKPSGNIIKNIAEDALIQDNLVAFGVFLHAWADTFSHEGFSGLLSKANDIDNLESESKVYYPAFSCLPRIILRLRRYGILNRFDTILDYVVPAYGHAQALHYPDEPYLKWSYNYDNRDIIYHNHRTGTINNEDRYRKAFESILLLLKRFLDNHPVYKDESIPEANDNFAELYKPLLIAGTEKKRTQTWQNTLIRLGLFSQENAKILTYDKNIWLDEAFLNYSIMPHRFSGRLVDGAILRETFAESRWYQFYKAVRWYKNKFHFYSNQEGLPFNHAPYI